MKKMLLNLAYVLNALFLFIGASLLLTVRVEAYIDPSVMTYIIQVVAGVIIAVGATLSYRIRKARKKVQSQLGISETKEQESDDIIINK